MGRKEPQNRFKPKFFRFTTKNEGGTLKIFGDELNCSILYETLLLSNKDTAEWIVKQMLLRYGLKHDNPKKYCLVQITIPSNDRPIEQLILRDDDCPLNIYLNRSQDSIVFKVIKRSFEYSQSRLLPNTNPLLIEIDSNGNNLLVPRLFQVHTNQIYVGCNTKTEIPRQFFCINDIGIEENHCLIEYENGFTRLIPQNGQSWLNGRLISNEILLQHGMIICFGKQSYFRFYDEKTKSILTQIRQNTNRQSMYSSLPILPSERKSLSIVKINILPALLEIRPEVEKRFLQSVFYDYPLQNIHFRLIPVYTIYLTIRQRLSPYDKSQLSLNEKQTSVLSFLSLVESFLKNKIQECQNNAAYLAYWLANLSELIFFLQQDRDLTKLSYKFQIHFIQYLQQIFDYLVKIFSNELNQYLYTFTTLEQTVSNIDQRMSSELRWIFYSKMFYRSKFDDIIEIFSSIIDLLRKCRVNAGLTIEIFSQLFHYINAYLFNQILGQPELKLCSMNWADFFSQRLKFIEQWAFNEGLERPYQCHLLKLNQLCEILQCNKNNFHDIEQIISKHSFQLNSKQIQQICAFYIHQSNESPISREFRENLLAMAFEDVDKNLLRQGFSIELLEEKYLNIPFYLPDNGYTCETLCGIPRQLQDFVVLIRQSGLCRWFTNVHSLGYWTQFLQLGNNDSLDHHRVETIVLNKKINSLGLIIVCIKNQFQQSQGIFIKDILSRSAAADEGHLQIGDRILSVNQINLENATQREAVEVLKQSGPSVTLRVMKNAADQYGFSELFRKTISNESSKKSTQRTFSLSPINFRKTELSPRTEEEYNEKLKRRLAQFEYERTMEKEYNRQLSAKRQIEVEKRLRQERERELRADHDIEQYRHQRLSLQDRLNDAEKEQNRLLKHIYLPKKSFSRDQSK